MFDILWLVPVLAETTEEEDDWVLESKKSKMKMRQRVDRDEVMAVHDELHANTGQKTCRRWIRSVEKNESNTFDIKKPINGLMTHSSKHFKTFPSLSIPKKSKHALIR